MHSPGAGSTTYRTTWHCSQCCPKCLQVSQSKLQMDNSSLNLVMCDVSVPFCGSHTAPRYERKSGFLTETAKYDSRELLILCSLHWMIAHCQSVDSGSWIILSGYAWFFGCNQSHWHIMHVLRLQMYCRQHWLEEEATQLWAIVNMLLILTLQTHRDKYPPSTLSEVPVMKLASLDSKKATAAATSSGLPSLQVTRGCSIISCQHWDTAIAVLYCRPRLCQMLAGTAGWHRALLPTLLLYYWWCDRQHTHLGVGK